MANQATTYKVDIRYDLKGNAASGLKGMAKEAKQAQASMGGLRNMLAMVGGGALLSAGYKGLIGFNAEVQKLKIGLATVTSMNLKVPFTVGQEAADRLFNTFQKMAAQSTGTTKDFVEMANMISSGVLQAGLGLKELESITHGAITASAALGARPDMLALDITQMLAGTVAIRDRYARQLLQGIGETDYLAFNKKSASERGGLVKKALTQQSLKDAAGTFENSFEGITSSLKDNLQIALGQVGLPLMKELTAEIKSWVQWISGNPDRIAQITQDIGGGLKSAFVIVKDIAGTVLPILRDLMGVIKDTLSFVADNKDLLLNVVKGLLVYKGIGMVGGMGARAGKGIWGLASGMGNGLSGLTDLKSTLPSVTGGFGALGSSLATNLPGIFKFVGLLAAAGSLPALLNPTTRWRDEDAKKRAEEIKTVEDYKSAAGKMTSLKARLANIGINADDNQADDLGGLKKEYDETAAGKAEFERKVIEQALVKGVAREELDASGTRRVTMIGPAGAATKEFLDTVEAIFRDRARNGAPTVYGMPRTADFSGVSGNMGYFEEFIGQKAKTNLDGLTAKPPDVKVTINKIEVYTDDADRFVAQSVMAFEEVARNPTQAHQIVRGAF